MVLNSNNNVPFDNSTPVPERSWKQRGLAVGIIVSILIFTVVVCFELIKSSPKASKKKPVRANTLVEVIKVEKENVPVVFTAYGKILPEREISLIPQVSGRVISIHKNFKPGGLIKKGEVILSVDDVDYKTVLFQKKAAYDQALADFKLELGNQNVARNEWQTYNELSSSLKNINPDLVLRKPQLEKAKAVVSSAKADLLKAELDLTRTKVKAPFDSLVRSKTVDIGSQISTQSAFAVLTGTENYWVEISLPVERLKWIVYNGDKKLRSKVFIHGNFPLYEASILTLQGDLEQEGLMAKLLVEIRDPFKNKFHPLIGSFVKAEIRGVTLENVIVIPREALTESSSVYTVSIDNKLEIIKPSVVFSDSKKVYIKEGLDEGDRLVTSKIPAPVEGMLVSIIDKKVKKRSERGNR